MAPRRDRDPSSIPWVAAKCLLVGALVSFGLGAYLAFSPLRNPDVQDCGSAISFILQNKSDAVVNFGRLDDPESVRLAQQPTCKERATPRMQEAMIAFVVFVGLGLIGAVTGLIDDRIAYHQAPRFETLLAERPTDATGRLRPAPQLRRSDIGRALPPVELWDVILLLLLGGGGLAALVWWTGSSNLGLVLGQVDWRGIAAAALLTVVGLLVAAFQLVASSPRRVRMVDAVEVSAASSFLGPVQPSLGPLGLDAHYLTRLLRNRPLALAAVRSRHLLALLAFVGIGVVVLVPSAPASLPTSSWPAYWYVPLGFCALMLTIGIARAADRYQRLVARPGWRSMRDLWTALRADPLRAAVLAASTVALPLVEIASFVTVAVAVHSGIEFGRLAAVWVVVRALAVASPLNRGVGFIEPLAALGLVAVGVPGPYAVTVVLIHRVLTLWLPMVPGARAARRLRKAGAL